MRCIIMTSPFELRDPLATETRARVDGIRLLQAGAPVAKKSNQPSETFGERLRRIRKLRGFTQVELARALRSSQRMIVYYEVQGGTPPADVVASMAQALDVSLDELVRGIPSAINKARQPPQDLRLLRRLRQVEALPPKERKSVLHFIDTLVENETLKKSHA